MAKKKPAKPGTPVKDPELGDILSLDQAIDMLGSSRPTVYRWVRAGKIKGMKVGRQWRFYRKDLERFLKGQTPRIDLPADIQPLVQTLKKDLRKVGHPSEEDGSGEGIDTAVDLTIALALRINASDIHVSVHAIPGRTGRTGVIRFRVDGVLHPAAEFDPRLMPAIAERWKQLAGCNPLEKAKPQWGRILVEGRDGLPSADLRLSFTLTGLGESLAARVLLNQEGAGLFEIDRLMFPEEDRKRYEKALASPWGVIVVTGPSGCGKTTTLYGGMLEIVSPERKTLTAEDPVEYILPWTDQIQIDPARGVGFPVAMRQALRSDLDAMMVGEIRDGEAGKLLFQMALTGHLMLTALHAPDAVSAVMRLSEIGVPVHAMAEGLRLVIAQRLVRRLCPDCARPAQADADAMGRAREQAKKGGVATSSLGGAMRMAVGCPKCASLGYRGRFPLYETLELTPEIATALRRGAKSEELRAIAVGQGMATLEGQGIRHAFAGETTLSEVARVLGG